MGDTPLGSSAPLSGDFERSYERERDCLEGIVIRVVADRAVLFVDGY